MTLLRLAGALLGPATVGLIALQGGCGATGNGGALKVTDTGAAGEFSRPAETAQASLNLSF